MMKPFFIYGGVMLFNSRKAFVKVVEGLRKTSYDEIRQWSDPIYPCPKCGGGMRQNMFGGRVITAFPPIRQNEYQCDKCGFNEFI